MHHDPPTVAIFGYGNLGSAVVEGAVRRRLLHPREVVVVEPDPGARGRAERLGCRIARDASDWRAAPRVVVSVKPQAWGEVAAALAGHPGDRLLISVMAGLPIVRLRADAGRTTRVARAMPNVPARLGLAITAIASDAGISPEDAAYVRRLFEGIGEVVEIPERHFHAVTALSGSGPAYIFRLAECLEETARSLGLPPAVARALVSRTIRGAGAMLVEDGAEPERLRDAVTSRGGTTAAALEQFERWGLGPAVSDAVAAAAQRSRELAGEAPLPTT